MRIISSKRYRNLRDPLNTFAFTYRIQGGKWTGTLMRVDDNGVIIENSGSGTFTRKTKKAVSKALRERAEEITLAESMSAVNNPHVLVEIVQTSQQDVMRLRRREHFRAWRHILLGR